MAGDESLAPIQGLAYFNKKDVCFTFSSDQLKPRKFQSCVQRRTAVGVYPIVYITHGIGVPFRKEGHALCYHIYTSLA